MEPPVLATASAGTLIFSLIRSWLSRRAGRKAKYNALLGGRVRFEPTRP